jgi:chromosome segregation ATPase
MTHKEDLLRLLKAEVEQLRKHYYESDAKIKNLENSIKEKDSIIEKYELHIKQQEVRMSYLEVGNNIVDEYIK